MPRPSASIRRPGVRSAPWPRRPPPGGGRGVTGDRGAGRNARGGAPHPGGAAPSPRRGVGGGGRRGPLPGTGAAAGAPGVREPAIDAERVIADLRELAKRTGDSEGAQRLCWGEGWRTAREFLRELLAEIGLEPEVDQAGNSWT